MSKYDKRRNSLRENNSQNNDQWIEEWETKFLQDSNLLASYSIDVIQGRNNYMTPSYSGFNEITENPVYHIFRAKLYNPSPDDEPVVYPDMVETVIAEVKNGDIIIDDVQNSLKVARRTFELLRDNFREVSRFNLSMTPVILHGCISEATSPYQPPSIRVEGEMTCKAEIKMMIENMAHYGEMLNKMVLGAEGNQDNELINEIRVVKNNLMLEQSTISVEQNPPDLGLSEPTTPVVSNNPNIKPATIKNTTPVSLKLRREIKTKNYIIIGLAILVVALIFTNPTIMKMIKR